MCFAQQPKPPKPQKMTAPPPVKPLQIAATSKLDPRPVEPERKKPVAYGSKSSRDQSQRPRQDAASLLVPLNTPSSGSGGGINA